MSEPPPLPRRRRLLFCIAMGTVGLLLPLLVEVGLRQVPRLRPAPLATEVARLDGQLLRRIDSDYAGDLFFYERHAGRRVTGGMAQQPFVDPKGDGLRVCFVGASTVQGFPHPRWQSAPAVLEQMLQEGTDAARVEVVNLGITSIASFAVRLVVEDALTLAPDAVVVYTGHNEFYGVYAGSPTMQQARRWASRLSLTRLARWAIEGVRPAPVSTTPLLQVMATRGHIDPRDKARAAAQRRLHANIAHIARLCEAARVPLILCTLAANESGFAPAAAGPPGAPSDPRIDRAVATLFADAPSRARLAASLALVDSVIADGGDDAWSRFVRGRLLEGQGQLDSARVAYRRARELDAMPWRAPRSFSTQIRGVAENRTGVHLADVEDAFDRRAPSQGVGWDLMVDHVHPSLEGQVLLAYTVYGALRQALPSRSLRPAASEEHYRGLLHETAVGRVRLYLSLAEMFSRPPLDRFNAPSAARFRAEAGRLWDSMEPAERSVAEVWLRTREQRLLPSVADALEAAGEARRALPYHAASCREQPYTFAGEIQSCLAWGRAAVAAGLPVDGELEQTLQRALRRLPLIAVADGVPARLRVAAERRLRALLEVSAG